MSSKVAALLALGVVALAAGTPTISLDPLRWTNNWPDGIQSGDAPFPVGMPRHPSPLLGMAGWYFDFPDNVACTVYGDICSARYTWQNVAGSISGKAVIAFTGQTVVVDGAPVLTANIAADNQPPDCPATVTARVMLFKKGLNWSDQNARWWSHVAMDLSTFSFTPTIAVTSLTDLTLWSNVYGQSAVNNPKAFQAVLANLGQVDLTFGGGCYYGHGVAVVQGTGHARFFLTGFSVS